jgi:hypothetical protein
MHCSRVDAFRHRADPMFPDRNVEGYARPLLTLTGMGAISKSGPVLRPIAPKP